MFGDFISSSRKNNIFYCDMFLINDKGCLFFGYGKTKAGRSAIQSENDEIGLDFICITREAENVFGHFEMEIRHKNVPDPIVDRKMINYLVRFLNEQETNQFYRNNNLEIKEISYENFVNLSRFNITFGKQSSDCAIELFRELTENSNMNKFIIVPWMNSHQEKGILLRKYIQ